MSRPARRPWFLAVLAALAVGVMLAASGTASGASLRACAPATYPGDGYFLRLTATRNVSCAAARRLSKDHYRCRIRHGKAGRCTRVDGYRCRETRRVRISTELDATVRCTRGTRVVVNTFQQFL